MEKFEDLLRKNLELGKSDKVRNLVNMKKIKSKFFQNTNRIVQGEIKEI